jgi:MFS transporter, DHA3 family, tetracycline resistance protein
VFAWRQRVGAIPVYLALSGASALFFAMIFTISAVYRIQVAGLNPLQLVLVGTALELAVFLFEIPTGVVADVYSRRLSLIIGFALIGAGFLLEGSLPLFGAILLAQALWGIGWTFTSGAREAWIVDEVGEGRAGPVFLRAAQVGQVATIVGALAGGGLATLQLNLPIVLGGGLFVLLALALALVMPERGFRPTPREERGSWRAMGHTFMQGARLVRGSPLLLTIMGIAVFFGLSSEGFDRLWAAHLLEAFTFPALGALEPVVWFAVINIGAQLLGLGATELARRRIDLASHRAVARALFLLNGLLVAGVAAFALAGEFWLALAAFWGVTVLRKVIDPVSVAWLNQSLDSRVRATVISMRGQADAFGQVAGGPVLGWIGAAVSLRAAMLAAAAALVPALALYARAVRQGASAPADREEVSALSER